MSLSLYRLNSLQFLTLMPQSLAPLSPAPFSHPLSLPILSPLSHPTLAPILSPLKSHIAPILKPHSHPTLSPFRTPNSHTIHSPLSLTPPPLPYSRPSLTPTFSLLSNPRPFAPLLHSSLSHNTHSLAPLSQTTLASLFHAPPSHPSLSRPSLTPHVLAPLIPFALSQSTLAPLSHT